jgi:PGF-pre-PGF domain-containing protein
MLRKVKRKLRWIIVTTLLTIALLLSSVALPQAYSQFRKATQLTLSPETFTVVFGQNITLTAKLTSDEQPLVGKQIVFAASLGSVNPNIATTDENGFASTVYTAPELSISTNVTVTASFLGDLQYQGSTATSYGTIEVKIGFPTVSISGASFAVPETLKDDVSSYRNTIPEDVLKLLPVALPNESFILATHQEDVFLVFANESDKGLAYVDGWRLPQNISLAGVSIGVIVAKSVTFEKEGTPTTISEILANPDNYKFKLVKISADRRQASMLYDHDGQPHVWLPITVGYLVEKPAKQLDVLRALLSRASDFAFKLDEQLIRSFLQTEEECLWLFNFEYEYWYDVPAITNGIVIPRDHSIFKLINQSMPVIGRFAGLGGKVVLYDVKTGIPYEEVSSVSELKANSKYVNKTVKIVANCYGGYISVQETLRKYADKDIPVDVRLEGLAAWNEVSIPPKREEVLLSTGASSFHQDTPFVNVTGVFELIGKVVSTREISDSLPEDVALLICWVKKLGEVDFEKLAQQVREEIRGSVGELYWALQDIYPYKTQPGIPYKVPTKVFSPKAPVFVENPREVPEIFVEKNFTINIAVAASEAPIKLNITNSIVSNISITLKETVRNVTIFFEKLVEKPPDVPEPPGLVYAYHEISINIPEGAIKEANITFWMLKEWLATHKVAVENVVMLRYHAEEWANLQTRVIGENATHYKFIAETPGFSTFAIIPEFASALIFILMLTTTLTTALWKIKRKRSIS